MLGAVAPETLFASMKLGLGEGMVFEEIRDNREKSGMTEAGPIMWKMIYYKELKEERNILRTRTIKRKKTGLVISCVETAV